MTAIVRTQTATRRARLTATTFALSAVAAMFAVPAATVHAQEQPPVATVQDSSTQQLTPEQRAEAKRAGEALGAKQGGWFGRSFAVGLFTLYVGPAFIVPIAATMEPTPRDSIRKQLAAQGPVYQATFEKAYAHKVRVKRVWTSVAGSIVGMAACVGMIMLSWDS